MNNVGAILMLGLGVLGACGVGDEGGPITDDRNEKLGIVCNATFDLTGSFTAAAPLRPADVPTGCWPVGTWTFTGTMDSNECPTTPSLDATYAFRVDRADPDGGGYQESYTYMGDQSELFRLGVSEGGSGECEGGLELYSADGTEYWNFKPMLAGTAISGFAEYAKFKTNQR